MKEKRAKVEEGSRVCREEEEYQESIEKLNKIRDDQVCRLEKAKAVISEAVRKREIFREYLQTVVSAEAGSRNRYKDIGELMKRCETLVVTRDESKQTLKKYEEEIVKEEEELLVMIPLLTGNYLSVKLPYLQAFKDAQNERILDLRLVTKMYFFTS